MSEYIDLKDIIAEYCGSANCIEQSCCDCHLHKFFGRYGQRIDSITITPELDRVCEYCKYLRTMSDNSGSIFYCDMHEVIIKDRDEESCKKHVFRNRYIVNKIKR